MKPSIKDTLPGKSFDHAVIIEPKIEQLASVVFPIAPEKIRNRISDPSPLQGEVLMRSSGNLHQSIFSSLPVGILLVESATGRICDANFVACQLHGYPYNEILEIKAADLIYQSYRFLYQTSDRVIKADDARKFNSIHIHRDGSLLFFIVGVTTVNLDGKHYQLICLHEHEDLQNNLENNFIKQYEQKRVEDRIHEQTTLLEISQTLSSTLDLDPDLILEQLRKILSFTHAVLFSLEDTSLTMQAVCGIPLPDKPHARNISLGGAEIPTMLFNGHQTTRIPDIRKNEPEANYLRSLFQQDAAVYLDGVQSWMWVPLAAKGQILGGLGIAHKELDYFTVHHSDLAQTVANQAAITMVNAQLYEHAQMYATLQERQRLARNLHDAVNQSLFSANLIAEILPRLWEKDPEDGKRSLEKLHRLTSGAMAEMRMMMAELRPITIMDNDLGDLIKLLSDAFTGRSNIPVQLSINEKAPLPTDVKVFIYRICQESLNNIAKHSKASEVQITISIQDNQIVFVISDDGCGFDINQISAGHYGISIMKERADTIGAKLIVTSHLGHGTSIEVLWPNDPG